MIQTWAEPHIIKIYEALAALGDGRIKRDENVARVYSSSGQKFYDVIFDPEAMAITSNDNGSYWKGYLGYPSIAFLCDAKIVEYDQSLPAALKGFAWKDINHMFKNDFERTQQYIRNEMKQKRHVSLEDFDVHILEIQQRLSKLALEKLPSTARPPVGY